MEYGSAKNMEEKGSGRASLLRFSSSILTIMLSIKFATFLVLIKFYRISFIIVWNVAREFVSLKNITVGLNNSCSIVNATFHSFLSFIHILLYLHHKFNLVNTFLVLIFSTISKIKDKG